MIRKWADLTQADFTELSPRCVAVLPLGATEQHGPHLSYNVDTCLIDAVLDQVETQADALQLPTLTITKSDEHSGVPGTLSLGAETLLAVVRDIVASVAFTGIKRLVFFNGHGGNTALLEIAARAARIDHGLIAAQTSWFAHEDARLAGLNPKAQIYDLHAGETETSAMLAVCPEQVDMCKACNFRTAMYVWEAAGHLTGLTGQPARPGWRIEDLNPDGAVGDASAATAAKGQQLIDTAAKGFGHWLEDFEHFDTGAFSS